MKSITLTKVLTAFICLTLATLTVVMTLNNFMVSYAQSGGENLRIATEYFLSDSFGAAPNARTMSDNLERVKLSNQHKPYSEYGFGARLTGESQGREYIEYDVANVSEIEVSAIIVQSMFAANHGWGVSLGVTDNVAAMPLNNINRINLNSIYPIYLSKDGRPFVYYPEIRKWMCYIAGGEKFSFAPSETNVNQMLRQFTVPGEVGGFYEQKLDGEGNPMTDDSGNPIMELVAPGNLYPFINVEYANIVEGELVWTPLTMNAANFKITYAKYLGGDKEFDQTVKITNIPASVKVRIGVNYTRETLKPSAVGDIEADVFEAFPKAHDESIFVHNIKLKMPSEYSGGFEETVKTGIAADLSEVNRDFAFGEAFNSDKLKIKDLMNDEFEVKSDDAFIVDSAVYNAFETGFYAISVKSGSYSTSYNVEVYAPDSILLDTQEVLLNYNRKDTFSGEGLKITAIKTFGSGKNSRKVESDIPLEYAQVDFSKADNTKAGDYTVTVTVAGVKAEYTISVADSGGCKSAITVGVPSMIIVVSAFAIAILITLAKKRRV